MLRGHGTDNHIYRFVANTGGMVVLIIDYRLAPETHFPL